MENNSNNNNNQQKDRPDEGKGYDPTARDFQRTENETDEISKSEIDHEKEEANKRTEQANTKPDKNNVW